MEFIAFKYIEMKKENRFSRYSFLIFGLLLLLLSNCKKDDDSNDQIKDIDGNVYKSITIGNQIWMVENLKTTKYRNGDPILNVADSAQWGNLTSGAFCNYNNKQANSNIYGNLYNWYAVNDSRNIAPVGWHVPTAVEWYVLIEFVGNKAGSLMETGTLHWLYNNDTDNSSGFTALPGGFRNYDGSFQWLGNGAYFWTSQKNSFAVKIFSPGLIMSNYDYPKSVGISIRCIKDL
jgi:uncharacterized protein (TIGR02145 family)